MRNILQERFSSGCIRLWEPLIAGEPSKRTLFITREINDEFDEHTWNEPSLADRYAALSADFDRYVLGETIPIGLVPYNKSNSAFMARIDPVEYGIWTIRSVAPKPAIRVFGAFCEQDTFVALLTRQRAALGGPNSNEWGKAREAAITAWNTLFPGEQRLIGDSLNVYFSEKAISV